MRAIAPTVLIALLLAACTRPDDTDTDTDTDTDVPPQPATELAGIWVGTEVDVLSRIRWKQDTDAMGDCEDGDEAICDSVLAIGVDGVPEGLTAGQLQLFHTDRAGVFEGRGDLIGPSDGLYVIQAADRRRVAIVHWTRAGGSASLVVHMKDKYADDPMLPERRYDATMIAHSAFTGSTVRFTGSGDLAPSAETTVLQIGGDGAAEFTLGQSSEIAGEPLRQPSPEIRYEPDALDGWLGIYHAGTNLDPASTDLLAGEQTAYGTVVAIPSREASSILLVTCEGSRSVCGDGAGGNLATWDLSRYAFALLLR
jgi:hypothetical protein